MNTNRNKYLVFLIATIVGLTGCGFFGASAPPDLVIDAGDGKTTAALGSHCWSGQCVDAIYPPVVETFVKLSSDGQIMLEFDGANPASAFLALDRLDTFPDAESVATTRLVGVPDTITWTPGLPAGDYVLTVSAKWEQGEDAAYHIGITIP